MKINLDKENKKVLMEMTEKEFENVISKITKKDIPEEVLKDAIIKTGQQENQNDDNVFLQNINDIINRKQAEIWKINVVTADRK